VRRSRGDAVLTPGDIVKRVALFFVGGSLVVAVLRGFPVTEPNQWYAWGQKQANAVEEWVTGWMGDVPFDELPPVDPIIPTGEPSGKNAGTKAEKSGKGSGDAN
jgi:hypothetical protein